MKISVVIPTRDRPDSLRRGLAGLGAQTVPRDRFEVVVVDDGSATPPDEVVSAFAGTLDVRVLAKPHGGLAAARNFGAERASGGLLIFLDDDIHPCPGFLESHVAAHTGDERVVALGALPHPEESLRDPFLYYLERVKHYDLFARYGSADRIPLPPLNGNSSVSARSFRETGGYDLEFSGYGGEDTEMGYRLLRGGHRFVYVPGARGIHHHVKDYAAYRRDMYASGVTMVAIVRRYPEVISRVNLDIVFATGSGLPLGKRLKRLLWLFLDRTPVLVRVLERGLAVGRSAGLRRPLFPLYLVCSHYHYGRGMRDEIARGGLRA